MRSGQLRHRITFQEQVETSDSMGGVTVSWQDYKDAWAGIYPLRAQEMVNSGQLEHEITHKVRTRYISGITAKMRIMFDSTRYLNIRQLPI